MRRDAVLAAGAARTLLRKTQAELELVQLSNRARGAEVERLHARESELSAEIEKMKATRAWRLHQTLQSWRGSG